MEEWSALSAELKRRRKARNLFQKEVLRVLQLEGAGMTDRHFRRIEHGERRPSRDTLIVWLAHGLRETDPTSIDDVLALASFEGLRTDELQRLGLPAVPRVRITLVPEDAEASETIRIEGRARGIPAGLRLWTVVHASGFYWPQRQILFSGDSWVGQARIGAGVGERGKQFDVLTVAADQSTDAQFQTWLERGRETDQYLPFAALPSGATQMAAAIVRAQ